MRKRWPVTIAPVSNISMGTWNMPELSRKSVAVYHSWATFRPVRHCVNFQLRVRLSNLLIHLILAKICLVHYTTGPAGRHINYIVFTHSTEVRFLDHEYDFSHIMIHYKNDYVKMFYTIFEFVISINVYPLRHSYWDYFIKGLAKCQRSLWGLLTWLKLYSVLYDSHCTVSYMTHAVQCFIWLTLYSILYDSRYTVSYMTFTLQYIIWLTLYSVWYDSRYTVSDMTRTIQYLTWLTTVYDFHYTVSYITHTVQYVMTHTRQYVMTHYTVSYETHYTVCYMTHTIEYLAWLTTIS